MHVDGVSQPSQVHLLEDSPDSLTQFLPEPEISAHPCDPRIASKAGDVPRLVKVDDARETPRTLNFNAIIKNFNSYVITAYVVRPVDDCVHQTFQPGVFGDEWDPLESSTADESSTSRHKVEDRLTSMPDLHRDRTFDPYVVEQFLTCACSPLGP